MHFVIIYIDKHVTNKGWINGVSYHVSQAILQQKYQYQWENFARNLMFVSEYMCFSLQTDRLT